MEQQNIFENIPPIIPDEIFHTILSTPNFKVERIISKGHQSQQDFWYDQEQHEWVVLLKGAARLRFDDGTTVQLKPGDYIHINAHQKHRVDWTTPETETIWLAIFY